MPRVTFAVRDEAKGGTESWHPEVGVWKGPFHAASFYNMSWFESRTIHLGKDVVKPGIRAFHRYLVCWVVDMGIIYRRA